MPDGSICFLMLIHCIRFQCFRSLLSNTNILKLPLGSNVALAASICLPGYVAASVTTGMRGAKLGRQPVAAKPPLYPHIFCAKTKRQNNGQLAAAAIREAIHTRYLRKGYHPPTTMCVESTAYQVRIIPSQGHPLRHYEA